MSRLLLYLLLAVSLHAQFREMQHSLEGTLVTENGVPDRLQVTAVELTSPLSRSTTYVGSDGTFEFKSLDSGSYEISLTTLQGEVIAKQLVTVPTMVSVRFDLSKLPGGAGAGKPGPISYYRLSHRIPGRAMKLFQKAGRAVKAGRTAESVDLLDKALAEDEQFADALHLRGLCALQNKDFQGASDDLYRAARLDDSNVNFLADAAFGLYVIESTTHAQNYAKMALRLDPSNRKANYVLALTMLKQGNLGEETVRALRQASPLFPGANRILNQLQSTESPR